MKKLIEFIIVEPTEDEFKRGHKYPFVSSELLSCDVQKLLDFFTLTESERLERNRKTSSVDSDLGISDSIISNNDNTWFEKRDDLYNKAKTEENSEKKDEKENSQEKADLPLTNKDEKVKTADIDENASEVINVENANEPDLQQKSEGLFN